ncbi:MAG TPA: o-succinylbenzoate synthase [Acidobacteriota bacterium]|nr:o-succinylbenzoate synthase [Acidobacteriota bacterium]
MRILQITLEHIQIPLLEPFRISNGEIASKDAILVRLETDCGIGVGEASPMSGSFYSQETPQSTWDALKQLAPAALAADSVDPCSFHTLLSSIEGEAFAKAGLEGAVWDAAARQQGRPLNELLGGERRPIPSGAAIGLYDTTDELLDRVERFWRAGYHRIKIKIAPGHDVDLVRAVRDQYPTVPLIVDANGAYTLNDLPLLRELDRFQLMMIEQPFCRDSIAEMAELQGQIATPICADESAESIGTLDEIVRTGAARIINIKVQRVGGLAPARAMHDRASCAGLPCWLGTMPELGVASAQGLHLATLPGFTYPTDVEASSRWFEADVIEPEIQISHDGLIALPEGAGIGYQIDEEMVEKYRVRKEVLKI